MSFEHILEYAQSVYGSIYWIDWKIQRSSTKILLSLMVAHFAFPLMVKFSWHSPPPQTNANSFVVAICAYSGMFVAISSYPMPIVLPMLPMPFVPVAHFS